MKPGNILVDEHLNVSVTDFGVSRIADPSRMTRAVGTPLYCAPGLFPYFHSQVLSRKMSVFIKMEEVMESTQYSYKADSYSFAFVMYETLFRTEPFAGEDLFLLQNQIIRKGLRPKFPEEFEDYPLLKETPLKSLIVSCWDPIANSRPDFSEIVRKLKSYLGEIPEEEENIPPIDKEKSPEEEKVESRKNTSKGSEEKASEESTSNTSSEHQSSEKNTSEN